jgi:choline dehydrogenase
MYRRLRDIFKLKPVQDVANYEFYPGNTIDTDEKILQIIKSSVQTVWHASCTCAMGTMDNPMAVIDSNARVFGVKSLRVVDASSFPLLPPGHPQSAICKSVDSVLSFVLIKKVSNM